MVFRDVYMEERMYKELTSVLVQSANVECVVVCLYALMMKERKEPPKLERPGITYTCLDDSRNRLRHLQTDRWMMHRKSVASARRRHRIGHVTITGGQMCVYKARQSRVSRPEKAEPCSSSHAKMVAEKMKRKMAHRAWSG